jgi:acetyl esterase/lipase
MLVDVRRRALLSVGLLLAGLMAGCSSTGPVNVPFPLGTAHRNLTYCNSQTLDLYIPRAVVSRPLPIAMYVHGGGMTAGDKSDLNPVFLDTLASAGYAVVSVNYRLAPQFRFPAQIRDVKCAIRYLRAKAPRYGLDGSEIFAFGTSVGGQLVALAALTGPDSAFDVGPYATEPSNLIAVADMFGPANLVEHASGFTPSGIQQVFGTNDHRSLALASPTHFVAPNSPPILLIQGVDDTKVLKSQSIELYRDLKAAGDHTQLVLVQNMGHMFTQVGSKPLNPSLQQIAKDITSFFDKERKM